MLRKIECLTCLNGEHPLLLLLVLFHVMSIKYTDFNAIILFKNITSNISDINMQATFLIFLFEI